ncbi:signal peptide peptidase-like 2B isoform X2 [Neomonachus schauinslandi]|nr:signal peptide peptidase-like 2B isoform X2 [Neomonachus schauinslandi]
MLVPPGGNKTQYDEIGIPVALLSHKDMLDIFKSFGQAVRAALYAPNEPMLDYNMVIIFIMAVGTVALGGYWAGSRDVKKRYMKHKRDDGPEKQEDEAVDVSPVMICVFVVMCCSMLVLLYYFYDQLVYVIIGIFCLSSSTGLYSCLSPLVQRLPFGRCRVPDNSLPYFRKRPRVSMLLLALLCLAVSVVWGIFRNEDQWAWILQDALGVAFCLYMLKTIRLPTFKACTLLLLVLFVYDVFFVFITPFLTKSGNSIMVEVATGPSDSATHEKLPMVLKVPRLNASPLALCDRPFSLLGFGDILVPGLLVAYCHRFDIQVQSSRVYFVACTVAYGIGLLVTFMALALMQRGQPALLYLVPCTLMTSCALALWRRELGMFWTGSGFAKDLPQSPWAPSAAEDPQPRKDSDTGLPQSSPGEGLAKCPPPTEQPPEVSAPEETGAGAPPPGAREPRRPHPRAHEPGRRLGLGGGADSRALAAAPPRRETPRLDLPGPPNLVLRSGRCPRSSSSSQAQLQPGPSPAPLPARVAAASPCPAPAHDVTIRVTRAPSSTVLPVNSVFPWQGQEAPPPPAHGYRSPTSGAYHAAASLRLSPAPRWARRRSAEPRSAVRLVCVPPAGRGRRGPRRSLFRPPGPPASVVQLRRLLINGHDLWNSGGVASWV